MEIFTKLSLVWHKASEMGNPVKVKLSSKDLQDYLADYCSTAGTLCMLQGNQWNDIFHPRKFSWRQCWSKSWVKVTSWLKKKQKKNHLLDFRIFKAFLNDTNKWKNVQVYVTTVWNIQGVYKVCIDQMLKTMNYSK